MMGRDATPLPEGVGATDLAAIGRMTASWMTKRSFPRRHLQ